MAGSIRGGTGAFPQHEINRRAENALRDEARTPFSRMTVAELRVWAQRLDIKSYKRLRREELAIAVREAYRQES